MGGIKGGLVNSINLLINRAHFSHAAMDLINTYY